MVHLRSAQSRTVPLPPTVTRYEELVNRFRKANELFGGMLNVLQNLVFEVYT